MKGLLFIISILINFILSAQTTVTLRPNASTGKDALIDNKTANANTNYGNSVDCASWAWTSSGVGTIARSLIQFDLSFLPTNAVISSANLSLFCNINSSVTQLQSGTNASYLQRITSTWDENTVTWNNQPTTTSVNQVSLATSTSQTQDYTNIDVTALIIDMVNNPTTSFGMMLKLQTEAAYRTMLFASSDYADSTKRPTLVITYTTQTPCVNSLTLHPNAAQGVDALIDNSQPTINFGTYDFAVWAWTSGGTTIARSLIKFDFSTLPSNATVNSAKLSLYCNTNSTVTQLQSGANASYLQRVTSTWSENTVNWNNQPTTTTTNQVSLAQSTSQTQNYLNIDITNLVNDILANPSLNFGMMLKLQTESVYRTMLFASSDNADSTKWPSLLVCYTTNTGVKNVVTNNSLNIFPNPTSGTFSIRFENNGNPYSVKIYNINGQLIESRNENTSPDLHIDNLEIMNNKGIYFIEVENCGSVYRRKIAIL